MDVDLNTVDLFVRVVDEGSFSAAARSLRLSVSTVSRRVAQLEEALGVGLLTRTTRSLGLTAAGRDFLDRAAPAVAQLHAAAAEAQLLQQTPRGRVRVTAPAAFGTMLATALGPLLVAHAQLAVEIHLTDRVVDLRAEGFDIGLRTGRLHGPPDHVARQLWTTTRCLFASPAYLRDAPELRVLADLDRHERLASSASSGLSEWALVRGEREVVPHRFEARLVVNEAHALAAAARAGLGVAFIPERVCEPWVARGELVRVLPDWSGEAGGLWLHFAPRDRLTAAATAVVDHLLASVARAIAEDWTGHESLARG